MERLAELFPELEELQVTLETIQCRWWPHKVNAWALSLSRLSRLKVFRWNCVPFISPDAEQVRVAMRSQAIVLAHALPNLHTVGFVDREDYLAIDRHNGRLLSVRWIGPGQSAAAELVTDRDLGLAKRGSGCDPFLAPPGHAPSGLSLANRCLSSISSTSLDSSTNLEGEFGSTSEL
ncbi:hypothetical protein CROQUDRAFT_667199 [Cronartium quercuum f. sp. fusiforme G11]|uniref:Uncharacterized protein n=1 Tax=Cronartium quercuum f. sp. fusiforme G11 TaxID=708437 RepID=A0A9P6NVC7_9BASI|nr:hypothetical protein CROQUDRAFT_667199 [Cronartium quercuum f. sp. fusiforme G11]